MKEAVLVLLFLLATTHGAITLHNQTATTNGASETVVLDLYLPASFGPFHFSDISNVPLLEIPRDCADQSYSVPFGAGGFVAVWPRAGACAFETVALQAQNRGAVALIIVNWDEPCEVPRPLFTDSRAHEVNIPVIEIAKSIGNAHLAGRTGELVTISQLPDEMLNVVYAFDWLITFGVIFQVIMFLVSTLITLWMYMKSVEQKAIIVTYWINFFFFLTNMLRAVIDPFWTMNYVPAVAGAFLHGNPNNFVIINLFWFSYILYVWPGPYCSADYTGNVVLIVIGEIVCMVLVGVDLHEVAWRFFPLWAGSILIIPMVFYSVVLYRLYRQIMETLTLANTHSNNQNPLKLARRIKLLGLFQAPLLVGSFVAVGLRGIVPVLFGYVWSAWIWYLVILASGLGFHMLGYIFWFAKLRGWSTPFDKTASDSGISGRTIKGHYSGRSHASDSNVAEIGSGVSVP